MSSHITYNADDAFKKLIEGNKSYVESGVALGNVGFDRRKQNATSQKPYAAVITCSDSRVIPEVIFGAGIGDIFVIRSAGNTVDDTTIASVEYAVEHLGVELVLVLGHLGCGAIGATIGGEFGGRVGAITRRIRMAINDVCDNKLATELNVRQGVSDLVDVFGAKIKAAGGIYDIVSGKVEFLSK